MLRSWSTKITNDFETNNPQRPNQEVSIVIVLHSLGDQVSTVDRRLGILEATVRGQTKDNATSALESDHQSMMLQQIKNLKAQLAEKTAETKLYKDRYKHLLGMYQSQLESPTAAPERLTPPPPSTAGTLPWSLARKFNEVSSKPSASKPSSATIPVTETTVFDSLGLSKTVTNGV